MDALLVAAAVAAGPFFGVFLFYAHTVMPGLSGVEDRAFVDSYTLLDRAIVNPVFLLGTFVGAPVLTTAAAVAALDEDPLAWVVVALGLQVLTVLVTARAHLPRNDALKAGAESAGRDDSALRAAFDERGWVRWNLLRVAASGAAAICLGVALLQA